MRTIVDIPDSQLIPLDLIARREGASRAELVRRAVALLLLQHANRPDVLEKHSVFGLWKDNPATQDSLEYQQQLRTEWDGRDSGF